MLQEAAITTTRSTTAVLQRGVLGRQQPMLVCAFAASAGRGMAAWWHGAALRAVRAGFRLWWASVAIVAGADKGQWSGEFVRLRSGKSWAQQERSVAVTWVAGVVVYLRSRQRAQW